MTEQEKEEYQKNQWWALREQLAESNKALHDGFNHLYFLARQANLDLSKFEDSMGEYGKGHLFSLQSNYLSRLRDKETA